MSLGCRQVSIQVAGRRLISELTFQIEPGQCWAMLGQNGAGKTSLLHTLAGLRPADGGEVALDGKPLAARKSREIARRVGMLFQDESADYWGSTLEFVLLGRFPHRDTDSEARQRAHRSLARLDLAGHADQPYRTLSGGERQRARIVQLLLQDPTFLLLDEPLNHLDLRHLAAVMEMLKSLATAGKAVLMTLHDPLIAARYCERAVLLYDAGRAESGYASEMLTRQKLEALYQCRLEPLDGSGVQAFFPSPR